MLECKIDAKNKNSMNSVFRVLTHEKKDKRLCEVNIQNRLSFSILKSSWIDELLILRVENDFFDKSIWVFTYVIAKLDTRNERDIRYT